MNTLTHRPDETTDQLPPQELTPYFRRCEEFDRLVGQFAAALGL